MTLQQRRLYALQRGKPFQAMLYRERKKELKRAINSLVEIPYDKWLTNAPELLEQKYMEKFYSGLVMSVGVPAARESVNDFLNRKADFDMWEKVIMDWIDNNAGRKIKIISEGFKEWFREMLSDVMQDTSLGVEQVVQSLYSSVIGSYEEVMEWQVRRIVQTETMSSLNMAESESIKALNIPFLKQWVTAGHNTREWHAVMEGVVVEDNELFLVNGEYMEYPTDDSNGATASNIINCSCGIIRIPK